MGADGLRRAIDDDAALVIEDLTEEGGAAIEREIAPAPELRGA